MALEDYLEPEVAVTAVVTAVIFSPRARRLIRRGLVYGTAGLLIAGDAITSFARNVGQGMQEASNATHNGANPVKATANSTQKNSTQKAATGNTKPPAEGTGEQIS
ncbi:MAG: hypothetical protein JO125_01920 [Chloroflexi bacterium]|nr:hypothetical protein [Ktedonobacteraceae bacterium]MBV8821180.1 hypothetical protein [Ktedonobacteraceae bacterium]MBV9020783.1 hypothetical protein [Ktedonobacteraceae bacterium]MBV9706149.1 hypothetical protein [Chloroflexota bacterium]